MDYILINPTLPVTENYTLTKMCDSIYNLDEIKAKLKDLANSRLTSLLQYRDTVLLNKKNTTRRLSKEISDTNETIRYLTEYIASIDVMTDDTLEGFEEYRPIRLS